MPQRESTVERDDWIIEQLDQTPWASVRDLVHFGPYTVSQIRKSLADMARRGLVRGTGMGATSHKRGRYVLTSAGVQECRRLYLTPSWYDCDTGVRDLADRLPMVEQFYEVIPKLVGRDHPLLMRGGWLDYTPKLTRFRWFRSGTWHAAAEFEYRFWFMFVWVGLWSSVRVLRDKWDNRLRGMHQHLPEWLTSPATVERDASPSAWVIVGHDLWAAQLGLEEVAPDESDDRKLVFVDGVDLCRGKPLWGLEDSVTELVPQRKVGNPARAVERIEQDRAMLAVNGQGRHAVFNVVSEYPGCTAAQVRRFLGDAIDENVGEVLEELVGAGLVARFERNYYLAADGSARAARIDRRRPDDLRKSLQNYVKPGDGTRNRYRAHDAKVMEIAIRLKQQGFPCANGWRANLHVDGMKTVTPDLVTLVGDGPYGHNWYYLEYEHSATTPKAVEHKVRTYRDFAEKDCRLPLIVVCDKKEVTELFLEKGRGLDIMVVTYTDIMSGPSMGDATVFRSSQGPVALYPAVDTDQLLLWPEGPRRNEFVGRWAPDRKKNGAMRWTP